MANGRIPYKSRWVRETAVFCTSALAHGWETAVFLTSLLTKQNIMAMLLRPEAGEEERIGEDAVHSHSEDRAGAGRLHLNLG
ncbi:MAG: hypothetical protein GY943_04840 [Chloroflexi bacterium]|nr:hypothetical protein [Chloroflexota bacterium]